MRAERARARVRRAYDGPEPWTRRDAGLVAAFLALGLAGLVIGWIGISDTVDLNGQTRWLGFGIGALMLGGLGMLTWLLTGLQAVAVLRREVLAETERRYPAIGIGPDLAHASRDARAGFGTVAGMRRYHRPECQMLAGKDITYASIDAHLAAGLGPCGVCEPPAVSSVIDKRPSGSDMDIGSADV